MFKCDICGKEFESGYETLMHRKECPPPIDWDNITFIKRNSSEQSITGEDNE